MTFHPKVSIVIPVFNGKNYLSEAIDSAVYQTYKNCEIIVVNDGSTDNTEEIALSYGNKIRYFKKENGGQSSALNFGIEKMEGEYFSWLSHDDKYYPTKIEKQIKVIEDNQEPESVIYCDCTSIDRNGNVIANTSYSDSKGYNISYYLIAIMPINGNAFLIPKKAFLTIGLFNIRRPHTSDVEFFFKLSRQFKFHYLEEELVYSRNHSSQATYRNYNYHIYECNLLLMDCMNLINNNELKEIANSTSEKFVLSLMAKKWSNAGNKLAYFYVLARLKNTVNIGWIELLKLKLSCFFLFNIKQIKRRLRIIIRGF